MKSINDWPKLIAQGTPIVGIEYYSADRQQVLSIFAQFAYHKNLNAYYWNSAYSAIQILKYIDEQLILEPTDFNVKNDILQFLLESDQPGIFLLEDILESTNHSLPAYRVSQLANAFFQSEWRKSNSIGYF